MIPRYLVNFKLTELKKKERDFLVVGSGIAGLFAALQLAKEGTVSLLTKEQPRDCSTEYAQGGIAAVTTKEDTFEAHYQDTIKAGAGLCNPQAVRILVTEGQQRIKELVDLGVDFDKEGGKVDLTKEGAHSCRRILHAGGDATGAEVHSTLTEEVLAQSAIELESDIFGIDLLTQNNRCCGLLAYDYQEQNYVVYLAKAVILATGGVGQLYQATSNPEVATGDGIAMAYRAGVEVMDLEFIQFHPTTLELTTKSNFLISEAVRGEGGVLRTESGERFMPKYHHLAELAPRDVVARAIEAEINKSSLDYVYLDITDFEADFIKQRFPTIYCNCLAEGIDITEDYIPVVPAAHYLMGGIKTDTTGATSLAGLFACGETAALGVHGANRLASNSLLDGLVYAKRAAKEAVEYSQNLKLDYSSLRINYQHQSSAESKLTDYKEELQQLMTDQVGIVRSADGLQKAEARLEQLATVLIENYSYPREFEVQNLLTIACLTVKAALLRKESRGAHYRKDYPDSRTKWKKHILLQKNRGCEEYGIGFE